MLYEIKTEKRRLRCYITFGFTCEVELDFPMFYEPASDWVQHLGWQDDFENFDNGIYCCSENDFAEILAIMQQAKNAFNDFAIPAFCEKFRGSSGNRQPLYDYKTSRGEFCSTLHVQEWRLCPSWNDSDLEPGWDDILIVDSAGREERWP